MEGQLQLLNATGSNDMEGQLDFGDQEVAGEGLGVIGDEQISVEVAVDKESMLW